MRVEVDPVADAQFGLIERALRHDTQALAAARLAYFAIIAELRRGRRHIWLVESEVYEDAFALHEPPLVGHFKSIGDDRVRIIDFQRMPTDSGWDV